MAKHLVNTALLQCSFGVAPSSLMVTPEKNMMESSLPAANIADHMPMKNIMPFGMCNTVSNPTVASTTAAALGVLTPAPCIPATSAPWMVGAVTVLVGSQPALSDDSKCLCSYGGVISITIPGQFTVDLGSSPPAAGAVAAAAAAAALSAAASNRAMQDEADKKRKEAEEALANAKTPEEQAAARAKMAEADEAQRKASTASGGNDLAKAKKEQAAAKQALAAAKTPEEQAAAQERLAKADQAVADAQSRPP